MQTGQMLAHYRVVKKIGAGGMGEVYSALDTVLDRDVALKLLPAEFASDTDRLTRFQREAKVLASLNHPNIASIYGFESTPEGTFLVMELVEGDDLSKVLGQGALPLDEAVDIARQIAEGLEEAHEKGIIHRDLKPANIKRTPEGKIKVLDFGLARVFAGKTAGEVQLSSAPTMTAAMTQAGTVLGTAAYMSPEQARGLEVDRRTDIWAFGVILFEMLTKRQIFAGETATDILAGILKTEPAWEELPADLPPQVERVLRRCLAKDPRQRLRDIGEARIRLENPAAESGELSGAVKAYIKPEKRRVSVITALPWMLLLISTLAVGWLAFGGRGAAGLPSLHLAMPAPEGAVFAVGGSYPGLPVVSPDSRHIVFSAKSVEDGRTRLYLRAIDTGKAIVLDGTADAQYPFWSPDGKWIAFFDRNEGLKKIMIGGGAAQTICPAGNGKGGSWNTAGEIIFTPEYNSAIQRVAAVGGAPRPITDLLGDEGFDSHRHPQFLPDGRRFLYLARGAGGRDSELRLADISDGTHTVVMNLSTMAQYASGQLLFLNQETLMAQPFDPDSGTLSGAPVPVAEDVMVIMGAAKGAFAASEDGTLIFLRGNAEMESNLLWLDRAGNEIGLLSDLAAYSSAVLSNDNRLAAAAITDRQAGTDDLWIVDIERNFRSRLTNHPAHDLYPLWTPDDRALLYNSDRNGHFAIYRQELGGTGEAELVFDPGIDAFLCAITPDGLTLIYSTQGEGTALDLWSVDLDGQSEPRLLRRTQGDDWAARISPDGRWISYFSSQSGTGQVYLAPWPGMTPITQVSTTTGTWQFWNRDGRELIFQEDNGRMMTVTLDIEGSAVVIGAQTPLFDHADVRQDGPWIDMAADGERFLAVNSIAADPPQFCDIVTDWLSLIEVQ